VQFAIVDRTDGTRLGDCASCVMREPPRTAEIGMTLAAASQGRGLAREAVGALVTLLFQLLRVHRVMARADEPWFKGEWTTLRCYAVLADEWRFSRPSARVTASRCDPESRANQV